MNVKTEAHERALRLMTLAVDEDWLSVKAEIKSCDRDQLAETLATSLLMFSSVVETTAHYVRVDMRALWSHCAQAMQP